MRTIFVQPIAHVESPESKRRIHSLLHVSGLLKETVLIDSLSATTEDVLRVHSKEYLARLTEMSKNEGGDGGDCAPFSPGGLDIALLAAGSAIGMVNAILDERITNGYCLLRPPGHHAERERGRGFCLLNNIAITAMHAIEVRGLERIVIIDWDVHHGNGTQQAFYDSDKVMFISIHQDRNYPLDTGFADELGQGLGLGFNCNIPLPPGSGDGAYREAIRAACSLAETSFGEQKPQLIMISCGFDCSFFDPLGSMMCHSETFRYLTHQVKELADRCCSGRLILLHEGGYSEVYAPFCGLAVLEELTGIRSKVQDPYLEEVSMLGHQDLQPHQQQTIHCSLEKVREARKQKLSMC
uniref:Histone deacetylase domain-containing protein n=1 Tax=Hanusia phi TaxID=3032 RepID=A0A6T7NXX2_9CRYP